MGTITRLDDHRPHLEGRVRCLHCQTEWRAVTMVGHTNGLQCPECGLFKGVTIGLVMPEEDTLIWVCSCGGELFVMTRTHSLCVLCGSRVDYNHLTGSTH